MDGCKTIHGIPPTHFALTVGFVDFYQTHSIHMTGIITIEINKSSHRSVMRSTKATEVPSWHPTTVGFRSNGHYKQMASEYPSEFKLDVSNLCTDHRRNGGPSPPKPRFKRCWKANAEMAPLDFPVVALWDCLKKLVTAIFSWLFSDLDIELDLDS